MFKYFKFIKRSYITYLFFRKVSWFCQNSSSLSVLSVLSLPLSHSKSLASAFLTSLTQPSTHLRTSLLALLAPANQTHCQGPTPACCLTDCSLVQPYWEDDVPTHWSCWLAEFGAFESLEHCMITWSLWKLSWECSQYERSWYRPSFHWEGY